MYHLAWWKVNAYSILVQLLQLASAYFVLVALEVDQQITDYLFIFLLSCLAYVLPFVGGRELAFVFGADFLGLDKELSLAISLFFYLSLALTSLTGLIFLLFPALLKTEKEDLS